MKPVSVIKFKITREWFHYHAVQNKRSIKTIYYPLHNTTRWRRILSYTISIAIKKSIRQIPFSSLKGFTIVAPTLPLFNSRSYSFSAAKFLSLLPATRRSRRPVDAARTVTLLFCRCLCVVIHTGLWRAYGYYIICQSSGSDL